MNEPPAIGSTELLPATARPSQAPERSEELDVPRLQVSLRKHLPSEGREFSLEVEFHTAPGITILFGPSGAGKTTLLDCVAGLSKPDSGRIAIGDRVWFDDAQRIDVPVAKRRVGYVFQNLALFPHLTVEQNVQYGLAHLPAAERVGTSLSHSAGISNSSSRVALSAGNLWRRESARGAGTNSGHQSRRAAARRTAGRARRRYEVKDHRRPAPVEPGSPHSDPVCHPQPRGSLCPGRLRDCPRRWTDRRPRHAARSHRGAAAGNGRAVGRLRKHLRRRGGVGTSRARHDVLPDRGRRRPRRARNSAGARRRGRCAARGNPCGRHSAGHVAAGRTERAQCDSRAASHRSNSAMSSSPRE